MPFQIKRTILYGDCDPAGVIYAPRAAHFIVEAVLEFLSSVLDGPAARKLFEMDILPPARSLAIEFLSRLTWDDVLDMDVSCSHIGVTSFRCAVHARRQDAVLAFTGVITQVCIAPGTGIPIALPHTLRRALAASRAG
jgi:acyl-CoA thioesterase FadM